MVESDNSCMYTIIFLEIEDNYIDIFRCCHFTEKIPENRIRVNLSDLSQNDDELKQQILTLSMTKPKNFRDLKYGEEKHCITSCDEAFHKPHQLSLRLRGCNLRCKMCWLDKTPPSSQSVELYKKLINIFKDDFVVYTTCSGEPFIYKNIVFNALKSGCNYMVSISNLTLLNDSDIEFLKQFQGKYKLISSVDSFTEDIYCSIRTPANSKMFNRVVSNFEKLANYKILLENNVTITQYNLNFEDLEKSFLYAEQFGVETKFMVESGRFSEWKDHPIVLALKEKYPNSWRI